LIIRYREPDSDNIIIQQFTDARLDTFDDDSDYKYCITIACTGVCTAMITIQSNDRTHLLSYLECIYRDEKIDVSRDNTVHVDVDDCSDLDGLMGEIYKELLNSDDSGIDFEAMDIDDEYTTEYFGDEDDEPETSEPSPYTDENGITFHLD
jgi:hypothetical protein